MYEPASLFQETSAATSQTLFLAELCSCGHVQCHPGLRAGHLGQVLHRTTWVLHGAPQSTLYPAGWACHLVIQELHLHCASEEGNSKEVFHCIMQCLTSFPTNFDSQDPFISNR